MPRLRGSAGSEIPADPEKSAKKRLTQGWTVGNYLNNRMSRFFGDAKPMAETGQLADAAGTERSYAGMSEKPGFAPARVAVRRPGFFARWLTRLFRRRRRLESNWQDWYDGCSCGRPRIIYSAAGRGEFLRDEPRRKKLAAALGRRKGTFILILREPEENLTVVRQFAAEVAAQGGHVRVLKCHKELTNHFSVVGNQAFLEAQHGPDPNYVPPAEKYVNHIPTVQATLDAIEKLSNDGMLEEFPLN